MTRICLYCARYQFERLKVLPLGIAYIAAYLIDKKISKEDEILIVDNIVEATNFAPHILGVSAVSHVMKDACYFANRCKQATGCLTILGGYYISCMPHGLPKEFDIGIISEGEITFAEVITLYKSKNRLDFHDISQIRGICYHKNEKVQITKLRPLIKDLDSLPLPYRHKNYSKEITIFTSRGCPYKCTFCASQKFWRNKYRLRSAESVVSEINNIIKRHYPRKITINIMDDLWMADKKRFKEIVHRLIEIKIPEKANFLGFCRSNLINEEEIILLKKMNFKYIRFGAETGSENLLKKIKGENISIKDHQRVIDLCQQYNIPCGASFMFGIPGETREDIEATIQFLKRNKRKFKILGFYYCNPIPGTEIWDQLKKKNMITENLNYEFLPLDFLKENFSWNNLTYFNGDNIPIEEFRLYIEKIKFLFLKKVVIYNKVLRAFMWIVKKIIRRHD